jgi:putative Mn2+ efflux pump MntP
MKCLTDGMMWYDWASVALLYCLGIWKLFELLNKSSKKIEQWIDKK